jgi:enoyl-CoA hydratase/carnithine racemase
MTAPNAAPIEGADFETLTLDSVGAVAVLTLNRPRARNAIDGTMRRELRAAVDLLAERDDDGVVLTGAGSAFCAGGDIRGMQERIDQGPRVGEIGWRRQRELHETLEKLYGLGKPTLAAINGAAIGLGLDLALTCDFVWAADSATLASSFIKRGLVPDGGGMYHLPRRVGLSAAKDLVYSGRTVEVAEAEHIGLVDRVVASEELLGAAVAYLADLGRHPSAAQAMAKSVLNRSLESSLVDVNVLAGQVQAFCYASPDHLESVRNFLAAREGR